MSIRIDITDADDPRLGDFRDLKRADRRPDRPGGRGLVIAEGTVVVRRMISSGYPLRALLGVGRRYDELRGDLADWPVPFYVADAETMAEVVGFHLNRGVLATADRVAFPPAGDLLAQARRVAVLEGVGDHENVGCSTISSASSQVQVPRYRSRIAILEGLVDPTNVGACFRSAAAMGVDAVLVTPTCADPLYRRSIRVSMGTVFQVPWTRIENWPTGIQGLKDAGYVVVGLTLGEGAITLDELVAEGHEKLALVFGTEGHGLSAATDRCLDRRVTIPMMRGVDSLNVAAASAVAFYATRQMIQANETRE